MTTFTEKLHPGYAQQITLKGDMLFEGQSPYQNVKFFDTERNGRVMALDDIVQITTRDHAAYSEMLTHLPIFEHGKVRSVLIVGGGDIAIAAEALKHKGVTEVVMAEIDPLVVEKAKEFFPGINKKAVRDKRLDLQIIDAFEYLGRPESKAHFDLIIADRPDPVGPAAILFADDFYKRIKAALKPGGFAVFQTGVPFYQPEEMTDTLKQMGRIFGACGTYLSVVPTYIGGFMALTWVSNGGAVLGDTKKAKKVAAAFAASGVKTEYYTPGIHWASFALPAWIARLVPKKRKQP
jgi:spermidine synthase